ncbi:MAG: hypothetical protein IT287_08125 [Bdellovibrionaceae bacterium]|nr:hypothetical protein [Pseudobdellovibrionaceae bacterium]
MKALLIILLALSAINCSKVKFDNDQIEEINDIIDEGIDLGGDDDSDNDDSNDDDNDDDDGDDDDVAVDISGNGLREEFVRKTVKAIR